MFQHMFASMHQKLDQIIAGYNGATLQSKQQFEEEMLEMKQMSDSFIEEWLSFEEKLADFKEGKLAAGEPADVQAEVASPNQPLAAASVPCNTFDLELPDEAAIIMNKGQGYYKLFMFGQAAAQFQTIINETPECNLARLFLGMAHMHLQNWSEAQRHFQLLIVLTDFPKWLAMGYNALGCIQAIHLNVARAEQLFKQACEADPTFKDPQNNLQSCKDKSSHLSLYFGSTELCCL
jgi:tetratricopeptide (TPR) repeat protein